MGYPKYYATYTVADTEAGFNPFWHSFLLLSVQEYRGAPILVEEAVGYYSQPSTTKNPVYKTIKSVLGLPVDLQNTHGVLKKNEEMRYIDKNGLHGLSFCIPKTKYDRLKVIYEKRIEQEQQAMVQRYAELGAEANGVTCFSAEGPSGRLRPFHIKWELTWKGLDSRKSYDCKHEALSLLLEAEIIDIPQREAILGGKAGYVLPRCSQLVERLRLISTGEPTKVVSNKGSVYFNRTWENQNRLYWATKPVCVGASKSKLEANTNQYEIIKRILIQLNEIETALRLKLHKRQNHPNYERRRNQLSIQLHRVQSLYESFRFIGNEPLTTKIARAEATLNVARFALAPKRANYSFILRAYQNIAIRNATLCLLGVLIASIWLTTPIGMACMTVGAVAASTQLYKFFKGESSLAKMKRDYFIFKEDEPLQVPLLTT